MRRGPEGRRTLCNACGIAWAKVGAIVLTPLVIFPFAFQCWHIIGCDHFSYVHGLCDQWMTIYFRYEWHEDLFMLLYNKTLMFVWTTAILNLELFFKLAYTYDRLATEIPTYRFV